MSSDSLPVIRRIGCAGLPPGMSRRRYFERLRLLETDVLAHMPPRPSVLRKWRAGAPDACAFSVVAAPGFGHTRDPAAVDDALRTTFAAAEALAAETIVVRTPSGFSPSARNREAVLELFSTRIPDGVRAAHTLVWAPEGLWDEEAARPLARRAGVVLATDPLRPDAPPHEGGAAYLRLVGLGLARRSYGDDQLERIADLVGELDQAWVVFGNPDKYRDARRLEALLGGGSVRT